MNEKERLLIKERYKELTSRFSQLTSEIQKYPEDSREYAELIYELSSVNIELCSISRALRDEKFMISYLKDLKDKITFGEDIQKENGKSKTR